MLATAFSSVCNGVAPTGTRAGTWQWNVQTGETVFNERWAEIVGYTLDELQPVSIETWSRLAHPDDLARSSELLQEHFAGKSPYYECEARMKHKDGHWVWVLDRGMVLEWDEDGQPVRMFGTHIDISERKRAQAREFELALEKERRYLLTTFIQDAAHEFRTPLSVIGTSSYIMSHSDAMERRLDKAKTVSLQVDRIKRLVDMLLLMVKLENSGTLENDVIAIDKVLRAACKDVSMIYGDAPKIRCEVSPKLPTVRGDKEYLCKALTLLIDNACKFTPPDGEVTLQVGVEQDQLWIDIQDTGPGISDESMPHIFKSFWRDDTAHSTPGLGLGLPIAQKIIEHHRGEIMVESTSDKGSCFRVTLPLLASPIPV